MKSFRALGFVAGLALVLTAIAAPGAQMPEGKLPPNSKPSTATPELKLSKEAAALVGSLGSNDYGLRTGAQKSLMKLGYEYVPALRKALAETQDLEVRTRLQKIIQSITTPRWLTDLDQARRQSKRTGKPILVFSTIGAPDGYS